MLALKPPRNVLRRRTCSVSPHVNATGTASAPRGHHAAAVHCEANSDHADSSPPSAHRGARWLWIGTERCGFYLATRKPMLRTCSTVLLAGVDNDHPRHRSQTRNTQCHPVEGLQCAEEPTEVGLVPEWHRG